MNQLTGRGFEGELADRIRRLAKQDGTSLNQAALKLLRKGTEGERQKQRRKGQCRDRRPHTPGDGPGDEQ